MTELQYIEFKAAVLPILDKYNIVDASFCGTEKTTGEFVAGSITAIANPSDHVSWLANIGRLWQYAREINRKWVNSFEGEK